MRRPQPLLVCAFVLTVAACGKKPPEAPVGSSPIRGVAPKSSADLRNMADAKGLAPSALVARVGQGSLGPYVAAHDDDALAMWISNDRDGIHLHTAPLDGNGAPSGPGRTLGAAPSGLRSVAFRDVPAGYVAVWTRDVESGVKLEATLFAKDGSLTAGPAVVLQGAEPPIWADAFGNGTSTLVFYAVSQNDSVKVLVTPIDAAAKPMGQPTLVADGLRTFQVVATARGAMVVGVDAKSIATAIAVDSTGKIGQSTIVGDHAELDIDAVRSGDRVVVAFGRREADDVRIVVGAVDASGALVQKPRAIIEGVGDQALFGLSASSGLHSPVVVAWEEPSARLKRGRRVLLSALDHDLGKAVATSTVRIASQGDAAPAIAAAPSGFAVVALAEACLRGAATCDDAALVPTFARFDDALHVTQSAPLFPAQFSGDAPALVWGLTCTKQSCFALTADENETSSVLATRLEVEATRYASVAEERAEATPPRALAVDNVASGARYAEQGIAKVDGGALLATITEHVEGAEPPPLPPDVDAKAEAGKDRVQAAKTTKKGGRSAIVSVRPLDASAAPRGAAATISVRALTAGGVAIAPSASGKEACIAWSARDEGDPQVFLTRVGLDGKKQKQVMLTRAKGEVGDVAIAATDDGWLVAWVDTRDGNGEVYAARVDRELAVRAPEQRITKSAGDSSDLALLVQGDAALVAFSDSRAAPASGAGDAFVAKLKLADATKVGDEVRLAATPEHARSVAIVASPDGPVVLWLDQPAASEKAGDKASIFVAHLDKNFAPKALPELLPLAGGVSPTSLGVACVDALCRIASTIGDGEALSLVAFPWSTRAASPLVAATPHDLVRLSSALGADPAPLVFGDEILALDDADAGTGRVRRVRVEWARSP